MKVVDLAVIGAGLSGCSLLARVHQLGVQGSMAVVEAGRGPGGRTATRRRRDDQTWRLDHGAPGFNVRAPGNSGVEAILAPLRASGTLKREWGLFKGLDHNGRLVEVSEEKLLEGEWLRGHPTMASVCEGLLEQASSRLKRLYGCRIRRLKKTSSGWELSDEQGAVVLMAKQLVLSGTLLAHPRSLSMLAWPDIPLREAVPIGDDPRLDAALDVLENSSASIRWNLMLEIKGLRDQKLPRQIWLTPKAKERWQVERLVFQEQPGSVWGVVVHGLDDGSTITPDRQPALMAQQEERIRLLLPDLIRQIPGLGGMSGDDLKPLSLGMMRWGAAQPMDHPLPEDLQWCPASGIGFCGDWIEGPGFGRAEGALLSSVALAEQLAASHSISKPVI